MTQQQIKANAPEGATHYSKQYGNIYYFNFNNEALRLIDLGIRPFPTSEVKIKPL